MRNRSGVTFGFYNASHKVEISERFKNHKLEFKGQTSDLKHVKKIDEWKLNGKNVVIKMSTLLLNIARFWSFSNIR